MKNNITEFTRVYAIADLHFLFNFILKLRIDNNLLEKGTTMDNYIDLVKKNWMNTVKDNDVVIFCGDLMSKRHNTTDTYKIRKEARDYITILLILRSLPGKKIWILGNHEREFLNSLNNPMVKEILGELLDEFRDIKKEVFGNVEEDPIRLGRYVFSHEPMMNLSEGLINVHGHIHSGLTNDLMQLTNKETHINVNLEFTDFTPTFIEHVLLLHNDANAHKIEYKDNGDIVWTDNSQSWKNKNK